MASIVAIYDACVLYPASLRDLLMHLAYVRLVRAHWTELIQEEWTRNLLANRRDLTAAQLQRTRNEMDKANPGGLVSGFERRIATLTLPDPDDRHVLAAAIEAGADAIVTFNLADFPKLTLDQYGIVAVHPDRFICDLFDDSPGTVAIAVRNQRWSLKKPPMTADSLLDTFLRLGLNSTVDRLRALSDQI